MMNNTYLTGEQVIDVIKDLAKSQGQYSRLYNNILTIQENEPEEFEQLKKGFEELKLKDPVDVIMFFEA